MLAENHNPITNESGKQYRCRNGEIVTLKHSPFEGYLVGDNDYVYEPYLEGGNMVDESDKFTYPQNMHPQDIIEAI